MAIKNLLRRSGEIGKHARFRAVWPQGLGGSSPLSGIWNKPIPFTVAVLP